MLKVAVVGYGYWGPNVVRNFHSLPESKVVCICDVDSRRLRLANETHPNIYTTRELSEAVANPDVDIVAVITPVFLHFDTAKKALENGKHIFVEKPFTSSSAEAAELIELAAKRNLKIMVDHTFLFTGAVRKIKEIMDENWLGKVYYYDSIRVNLGLFQPDVNVIWDLGPHDFSVMDYVIPEKPQVICAHGIDHFGKNKQDVAYVVVYCSNDLIAHFSFNWLSPVKVRKTLIGGAEKMLVWDDLEADEKIKIYDKGVAINSKEGFYDLLVEYRSGNIFSPKVDRKEALRLEAEHFVDALMYGRPIVNDGHAGMRVVRLLEACDESIRNGGKAVKL